MVENIRKSKKIKIYSFTKIVMFFLVLVLLVAVATKVVERKNSVQEYSDFMKLSNQIDVLFLGSSHVLDGVNPLQLFAEYGITSYNMAKHGGMLTESYWTLMNALDYCEPKCIVVDLWSLDRDYRYLDTKDGTSSVEDNRNSIAYLHNNLDFWPMSKTKITAINDLIGEYEIRKEFYWDFITYHDRWSSLNSKDFEAVVGKDISDGYLGANPIYIVEPRVNISQEENTGELIPEDTVSIQYLYKIIDECKKRDIELIFTFLPMAFSYRQDWMAVDTAEKIANENNILFLDMLPHDSQRVVNYKTDMSDDSHANTFGMRKISSYIGKYLCEIDGIADHRGEADYQVWSDKVSRWQGSEIQKLLGESNLYMELGLIYNLNANAIIYMKGNSQALQDPLIQEFIMQLSGSTNILEAAECNGPYLLIREATSGAMQVQEFVGEQQVESFESVFGDTFYIGMKEFSAIYVDGNLEYNYLDMDEHYTSDVQISILGQEGEIMSRLFYDPNWDYMEKGNME